MCEYRGTTDTLHPARRMRCFFVTPPSRARALRTSCQRKMRLRERALTPLLSREPNVVPAQSSSPLTPPRVPLPLQTSSPLFISPRLLHTHTHTHVTRLSPSCVLYTLCVRADFCRGLFSVLYIADFMGHTISMCIRFRVAASRRRLIAPSGATSAAGTPGR